MSQDEEIFLSEFSEKAGDAEKCGQKITRLARQCAQGLGAVHAALEEEIGAQLDALDREFRELGERLAKPVLRVAVFGTTSSAKSTLLNFLIGENLLPTDVGEKSAGTVRIVHSPIMELEIEDTKGRIWECGKFEAQDAREICSALNDVMDAYRNAMQNGEEMDAPSFVVKYPTNVPAILNLPEEIAVELMDLPGIKFTGDVRNRAEIGRCREALCLVTFGSQETDPVKQDVLLDDAIAQVQAIGSPIGRMLFVATRVDEFFLRSPENWPGNEREFMEDRLNAIREKMAGVFPEQDAAKLNLTSISPLPAFYSQKLYLPEAREEVWRKIRHSFLGLVEGGRYGDPNFGVDLEVDVNPSFRLWEEADWEKIIGQLEETTHAVDFVLALKDHILNNFSSIVMPAASADFVEESANVHDWLAGEMEFARNAVARDFEEQKDQLEKVVEKLHEINRGARERLEAFLGEWLKIVFEGDGKDEKDHLKELDARYPDLMGEKLASLHGWTEKMREAYLKPYNAVIDKLLKNLPLPQNLPDRVTLDKFCASLRKNGYSGNTALNGVNILTTDPGKGAKFSDMVKAFNNLGDACAKSAQKSLQDGMLFYTDKILEALKGLQDSWLACLDREYVKEIPPEFSEVAKVTPNALRKFVEKFNLEAPIRMRGGAEHTKKEISELKEEKKKSDYGLPPLDYLVDKWNEIWGNDKIWRPIRIIQNRLSIPPIRSIRLDAQKALGEQEKKLKSQMIDFASGQMDLFRENIAKYQANRIEAYRKRLDDLISQKAGVRMENEARLDEVSGLLDEISANIEIVKNY